MKLRVLLFGICIAIAFGVLAADVTGKWIAQVPGRDGQTRETVFNLKVEGENLTGTVSGMQGAENPISEGKVAGDDLSFVVKMSRGGNEIKFLYKGKAAGDEIKFTRTREGADQSQEFTAKRAK